MNYIRADYNARKKDNLLVENSNIPYQRKMNNVYYGLYIDKQILDNLNDDNELFNDISNMQKCKTDVYWIYSDGGSFNNGYKNPNLPMLASTGTIVIKNDEEIFKDSKLLKDSTNNVGELTAGINGLKFVIKDIKKNKSIDPVIIMSSDSQYLMKGINEWLPNWKKRNWINSQGQPVLNKELWEYIDDIIIKYNVLTCWVRGHQKSFSKNKDLIVYYNNQCDYLCNSKLNEEFERLGLPLRKL